MAAMILATKGASESVKSVVNDLANMIEVVPETCFDIKKNISVLGSYMDINECTSAIFFECTKRAERLWLATESVSLRFTVHSLQSVYDLSTATNYHKNGGHVLLFSEDFGSNEGLRAAKPILEEVFSSRRDASIERVLCFYHTDGRVHVRNYTVDGMAEVGPRLEMELDKVLCGCFRGKTVFNRNTE